MPKHSPIAGNKQIYPIENLEKKLLFIARNSGQIQNIEKAAEKY